MNLTRTTLHIRKAEPLITEEHLRKSVPLLLSMLVGDQLQTSVVLFNPCGQSLQGHKLTAFWILPHLWPNSQSARMVKHFFSVVALQNET